MEISKKSWHYRLNLFFAKHIWKMPSSLCGYFWYTIFSMLKSVGLAAGAALIASILYVFLAWWFSSLSIIWTASLEQSFLAWFIFGINAWAIAASVTQEWWQENTEWEYPAGAGYRHQVLKKPCPWFLRKITLPKIKERPYNPNSFRAVAAKYFRAWHDKVCPHIKYCNPQEKE